MTLAPHDQATLDRITGIMPDPGRWLARDIARRDGWYVRGPESRCSRVGAESAHRVWPQLEPTNRWGTFTLWRQCSL